MSVNTSTSTRLRAPDPTLDAYGYAVLLEDDGGPVATAHKWVGGGPCPGGHGGGKAMRADQAAYIAVPCRECFPDAPEPGERPCLQDGCRMDHGKYLRWQTEEPTDG